MGREPESAHQFEHQTSKWSLPKEMFVVRCDDGTIYEFESPKDTPEGFTLTHAFQPSGEMTHTTKKVLPAAVEETVETLIGGWSK